MNEDLKLILRLLLERELEGEAGQNVRPPKKKLAPEPTKGIDDAPDDKKGRSQRSGDTAKDTRLEDFLRARSDLYAPHGNNICNMKEVPIWEKYALTVTEAAEYFHIGTKKLRQVIARDKYAKYLIWNGGRVFIKRKMFEEYLNNEIQL